MEADVLPRDDRLVKLQRLHEKIRTEVFPIDDIQDLINWAVNMIDAQAYEIHYLSTQLTKAEDKMTRKLGGRETPEAYDVRYRYNRPKDPNGNLSAYGGETTCILVDRESKTEVAVGLAMCRPNELFDKDLGRHISLQRAIMAVNGEGEARMNRHEARELAERLMTEVAQPMDVFAGYAQRAEPMYMPEVALKPEKPEMDAISQLLSPGAAESLRGATTAEEGAGEDEDVRMAEEGIEAANEAFELAEAEEGFERVDPSDVEVLPADPNDP